jgi:hypothetical protein
MADYSVGIYGSAPHQVEWGSAFAKGLARHGIEPQWYSHGNYPLGCDIAVFWSIRKRQIIESQKAQGRDFIVLERGYFGDRFAMASAGWNGLNGRADFKNNGKPGNRWAKHGLPIADYHDGKYALILGQVPGDMSHAHSNIEMWYSRMIREWASVMPVAFRHHPGGDWHGIRKHDVTILRGPLEDALQGAAVAVTFNSNSGVDALLSGVPVYAEDEGSMVYGVASHTVGQLLYPERQQWANELAYCQWTQQEMASGEAWECLRHGTKFN